MNTNSTALLLLLLTALAATACGSADEGDRAAARSAFKTYRQALGDRDGQRAAALLGPATVAYYGEVRDLALSADEPTLKARRLVDRLNALSVRAAVPADALERLDGLQLYARAVGDGFVAGDVDRLTLGEVSVDGDRARAALNLDGHALPFKLTLLRVDGRWLIELNALFALLDGSLRSIPRQLERDENEWLLETVAAAVKHPVDADLWNPPRP